ncbi:MAG: hypothetical protein PWR19_272 [Carnobacterium sp.]|nr:hypothetical protein [Carnobacterium sp.]
MGGNTLVNKFDEFLKITTLLNESGITPLLMGSLGLEYVTQKDWNARDVDIHVPGDPRGWEAPDNVRIYNWSIICTIMKKLGYQLIDLHEHEFSNGVFSVEFGVLDTLPKSTGIPLDKLELKNEHKAKFFLPSEEQYLKIYTSSFQDSYRAKKIIIKISIEFNI